MSTKVSAPFYAGIFFTAMSVLIFQIALTRLFAILMWYHFSYLIVSLALLGFGASGSLLAVFRIEEKNDGKISKLLASYALIYGVAILLAFFIVTRIEINSFEIWKNPQDFLKLLVIFIILSVPFLFGGLTIGTCLTKFSSQVGKLYCVDLIGSATGALITPLLLSRLGLTVTIIGASTIALLGATLFASMTERIWKIFNQFLLVTNIVLLISFNGGVWLIPELTWNIPFSPNKWAAAIFPKGQSDKIIPSDVAQVNVSDARKGYMYMGGEFGNVDKQRVISRIVTQDGTAPTLLFKDASNLKQFPSLDDTQAASAYVALKALGRKNPEVMIIGVGGGIDVMVALFHDAADVTAVEINKAMIRIVTKDYTNFIGHLFNDPRVKIVNEDGRSYLHRISRKFDIIQLSGVDTFTALSTGAYTLSESYLYTIDAIKQMYTALKDNGGYINYSRITVSESPRETIRLVNIAYEALKEMGVSEPWRNIAVLQADTWASTMIRKGPITLEESKAWRKFAQEEGFKGLIFDPHRPLGESYGPEIELKPEIRHTFIQTQKDFEVLLRGTMDERKTFISKYDFILTPSTDDNPFFFNYFKFSSILNPKPISANEYFLAEYLPSFPVGHMVLFTSLFMISTLSFILILLPLKFFTRLNIQTPIKLRTFIYFASLGVGFMFIEICLMQQFILFLGSPVYAMSVILAGILAYSGLGALCSSRITPTRSIMHILLIIFVVLSCINAFAIKFLLVPLFSHSFGVRVIITLVFLAPIAFVMGMPFPLGIRMLNAKVPKLIPWAWGINGFLSVLSSIMAIVLAMLIGFSKVLVIAGIIYAFGFIFAPAVSSD